jgi:cytochrome d ubiquinol oxidase subunit I
MDVLMLSRLQFAFTAMFHYLFPPLTIGLAIVLVYLQYFSWRTGEEIYHQAARFWTKIFGINFALGVATGIVMEFEFGTNWAVYSRYVGDVFGSALAAEGIFAFFLESGFLAVLLFGWDRVSRGMHFFATLMVAVGGIFSSVWIVVANSWQQTPAGFHLVEHEINGQSFLRAEITDFWQLVFNPSTVNRLVHVWLGAFILGAFFVMSISAYYLLKRRHQQFARRSFTGALLLAVVSSWLQLASGHFNADMVAEYQPAKLAAFEGIYRESDGGTELFLFGWPDDAREEVHGVSIPGLLSLLVHHDPQQPVPSLEELEDTYGRPPVWLSFQTYHLMIAIGMLFIFATTLSCYWWYRGTLFEKRPVLWFYVLAVVLAFIANESGWVAAEVGRQPWIVYPVVQDDGQMIGGLKTSEALSEVVRSEVVLGSLIMFGFIYLVLFILWLFLLNRAIQQGPSEAGALDHPDGVREQMAAIITDQSSGTAPTE